MFVLFQESSESANTTIEDEDIKGTVEFNRLQLCDTRSASILWSNLWLLYIDIYIPQFSEQ